MPLQLRRPNKLLEVSIVLTHDKLLPGDYKLLYLSMGIMLNGEHVQGLLAGRMLGTSLPSP